MDPATEHSSIFRPHILEFGRHRLRCLGHLDISSLRSLGKVIYLCSSSLLCVVGIEHFMVMRNIC